MKTYFRHSQSQCFASLMPSSSTGWFFLSLHAKVSGHICGFALALPILQRGVHEKGRWTGFEKCIDYGVRSTGVKTLNLRSDKSVTEMKAPQEAIRLHSFISICFVEEEPLTFLRSVMQEQRETEQSVRKTKGRSKTWVYLQKKSKGFTGMPWFYHIRIF